MNLGAFIRVRAERHGPRKMVCLRILLCNLRHPTVRQRPYLFRFVVCCILSASRLGLACGGRQLSPDWRSAAVRVSGRRTTFAFCRLGHRRRRRPCEATRHFTNSVLAPQRCTEKRRRAAAAAVRQCCGRATRGGRPDTPRRAPPAAGPGQTVATDGPHSGPVPRRLPTSPPSATGSASSGD